MPASIARLSRRSVAEPGRLILLVDDMLVMARADAGGYPMAMTDVDLGDLAGESVRDLAFQASQRLITTHERRRRDLGADVDVSLRCLKRQVSNGLAREVSEIDVRHRHRVTAGVSPGHDQHVVNQPCQTSALLRYGLESLAILAGISRWLALKVTCAAVRIMETGVRNSWDASAMNRR